MVSMRVSEQGRVQLQDLYHRFDGADPHANARLAWYGQCRAQEMSHEEAIASTANHFPGWVAEYWPMRKIEPLEGR